MRRTAQQQQDLSLQDAVAAALYCAVKICETVLLKKLLVGQRACWLVLTPGDLLLAIWPCMLLLALTEQWRQVSNSCVPDSGLDTMPGEPKRNGVETSLQSISCWLP